MVARAAAEGRGAGRRTARRDRWLALARVPRFTREPVARRAGGLSPSRSLRLRLRRDRAGRRQVRGELPPDRPARAPADRCEEAAVRGLATEEGGAGPAVLRRGRRG